MVDDAVSDCVGVGAAEVVFSAPLLGAASGCSVAGCSAVFAGAAASSAGAGAAAGCSTSMVAVAAVFGCVVEVCSSILRSNDRFCHGACQDLKFILARPSCFRQRSLLFLARFTIKKRKIISKMKMW